MKIKWEIINAEPDFELLTVKFTNDAAQELWHNFNPMLWTDEAIVHEVEGYGPYVVAFFERVAERGADVASSISESGNFECEAQKFWLGGDIPDTIIPPEPEYDAYTQRLELSDEEIGAAEHTWIVVALTADEQAEYMELVEGSCRYQRDQMLFESDFVHLPDVSVSNMGEWADYRQALRDVPAQSGFPKQFNWPTKPEAKK